MSKGKTVLEPCAVERLMDSPDIKCDRQESVFFVQLAGQTVGYVCREHVHEITESEQGFKHGFANWSES